MKQKILRWTAAALILLTAAAFFLPWTHLHLERSIEGALVTELGEMGLNRTAQAMEDGKFTAFETGMCAAETGALLGSEAWRNSGLGAGSRGDMAPVRFVLIVFFVTFLVSLLLLACDLVVCLLGTYVWGKKKRGIFLLFTLGGPVLVLLLGLLHLVAGRLAPAGAVSPGAGLFLAAAFALGAGVTGVCAAGRKTE